MRSRVLLSGAATAALTVAGCGSSNAAKTVKPTPVSAAVIAHAAERAAAQPGYAFQLSAAITGAQIDGTLDLSGSAKVSAKQPDGSLNVNVTPPGSLAALGSLQTRLIITGGTLYIQVPASLKQLLPGAKPWLSAGVSTLAGQVGQSIPGLTSTSPATAWRMLAKASTGNARDYGSEQVSGQVTTRYREQLSSHTTGPFTLDMWIASGLPRQVRVSFHSSGASGRVTLTFSSFAAQPAPSPPANSGSLSAVLGQALKTGL